MEGGGKEAGEGLEVEAGGGTFPAAESGGGGAEVGGFIECPGFEFSFDLLEYGEGGLGLLSEVLIKGEEVEVVE